MEENLPALFAPIFPGSHGQDLPEDARCRSLLPDQARGAAYRPLQTGEEGKPAIEGGVGELPVIDLPVITIVEDRQFLLGGGLAVGGLVPGDVALREAEDLLPYVPLPGHGKGRVGGEGLPAQGALPPGKEGEDLVDEALNDDEEDAFPSIMQAEGGGALAAAETRGTVAGDLASRHRPSEGVYFLKGLCYHLFPLKVFWERRALPGSPLVYFPAYRFRSRAA